MVKKVKRVWKAVYPCLPLPLPQPSLPLKRGEGVSLTPHPSLPQKSMESDVFFYPKGVRSKEYP